MTFPRSLLGLPNRLARRWNPPPPSEVTAAASFWDNQVAQRPPLYWAEFSAIRGYVNTLVTGVDWLWPLNAFKVACVVRPARRALSIGCGTGSLERASRLLGLCEEIEGVDISRSSIRIARASAKEEGLRNISYRVEDCNALALPRDRYDLAFFHGSLHHISDPDALLANLRNSLRPGGLLYIDEYVGPSRDEWSDEHLVHARDEYDALDDSLKLWPVNPPLDYSDPSEMIRSSRILPAVRANFEIVHYRPYWGNLLFPLLCALDTHKLNEPQHEPLIRRLIERERQLVAEGLFANPLYAVVVARAG